MRTTNMKKYHDTQGMQARGIEEKFNQMVTFYDGTNYVLSELDPAQYGWVSLERVLVKMGNIHAWTGVLSQQIVLYS